MDVLCTPHIVIANHTLKERERGIKSQKQKASFFFLFVFDTDCWTRAKNSDAPLYNHSYIIIYYTKLSLSQSALLTIFFRLFSSFFLSLSFSASFFLSITFFLSFLSFYHIYFYTLLFYLSLYLILRARMVPFFLRRECMSTRVLYKMHRVGILLDKLNLA